MQQTIKNNNNNKKKMDSNKALQATSNLRNNLNKETLKHFIEEGAYDREAYLSLQKLINTPLSEWALNFAGGKAEKVLEGVLHLYKSIEHEVQAYSVTLRNAFRKIWLDDEDKVEYAAGLSMIAIANELYRLEWYYIAEQIYAVIKPQFLTIEEKIQRKIGQFKTETDRRTLHRLVEETVSDFLLCDSIEDVHRCSLLDCVANALMSLQKFGDALEFSQKSIDIKKKLMLTPEAFRENDKIALWCQIQRKEYDICLAELKKVYFPSRIEEKNVLPSSPKKKTIDMSLYHPDFVAMLELVLPRKAYMDEEEEEGDATNLAGDQETKKKRTEIFSSFDAANYDNPRQMFEFIQMLLICMVKCNPVGYRDELIRIIDEALSRAQYLNDKMHCLMYLISLAYQCLDFVQKPEHFEKIAKQYLKVFCDAEDSILDFFEIFSLVKNLYNAGALYTDHYKHKLKSDDFAQGLNYLEKASRLYDRMALKRPSSVEVDVGFSVNHVLCEIACEYQKHLNRTYTFGLKALELSRSLTTTDRTEFAFEINYCYRSVVQILLDKRKREQALKFAMELYRINDKQNNRKDLAREFDKGLDFELLSDSIVPGIGENNNIIYGLWMRRSMFFKKRNEDNKNKDSKDNDSEDNDSEDNDSEGNDNEDNYEAYGGFDLPGNLTMIQHIEQKQMYTNRNLDDIDKFT